MFSRNFLIAVVFSVVCLPITQTTIAAEGDDGHLLPWDHWEQRHLPLDPARPSSLKPVVLIVPGMLNADDSMSIFKDRFSQEQIPAALFRYDSILGVERVAKKLTSLLESESQKYPSRKIILLTHSMGGVVCRRVVEDPAFKLDCVSHLIMVAPPNAGSSLATIRGETVKELAEGLRAQEMIGIVGKQGPAVINEALGLYTGQAKVDLTPDSELLRKVNGFKRNPRIRYTVIAGTKAPIPEIALNAGGLLLQNLVFGQNDIGKRFDRLMKEVKRDEWINGKGDGAVTIVSARLPDVADHVELGFGHCDTCRDPEEEENKKLIDNVMQRIITRVSL